MLVVGLALVGCDQKPADGDTKEKNQAVIEQPQTNAAPEKKPSPKTTPAPTPAEGWAVADASKLEGAQKESYLLAVKGRNALGQRLMKKVTEAVSKDGHVGGIKACKIEAPAIASAVSQEHNIQVGRTSYKLRNPENAPKDWVKPVVDAKYDKPIVFTKDQTVGLVSPIKLGEMCTSCHGTKDKLAEGVSAELATLYPQDQATDFNAGDLRGWFWVEVTPNKPEPSEL